jgi:hypothetical protein
MLFKLPGPREPGPNPSPPPTRSLSLPSRSREPAPNLSPVEPLSLPLGAYLSSPSREPGPNLSCDDGYLSSMLPLAGPNLSPVPYLKKQVYFKKLLAINFNYFKSFNLVHILLCHRLQLCLFHSDRNVHLYPCLVQNDLMNLEK